MSRALRMFAAALQGNSWRVTTIFFFVGFQVLVTLTLPWPVKLVVDNVLGDLSWPNFLYWLPLTGEMGEPLMAALLLACTLLFLFIAQAAITVCVATLSADVAAKMRADLASQVLNHTQELDLNFHNSTKVGDLTQRIVEDTQFNAELLRGVLIPAVTATCTLIAMLAILSILSPILALSTLLVSLPIPFLVRYFKPIIIERSYRQQQSRGALMSIAEQSISSIQIVQAFGREEDGITRFRTQSETAVRTQLQTTQAEMKLHLSVGTLQALGTGAALLFGSFLVLQGTTTVGTLVVALAYVKAVFAPVQTLAGISTAYGRAIGKARRILEIIEVESSVQEVPTACPLPGPLATGREIILENVTYGYQEGRPVLDGVNLVIRPGETVALIGETGAGKSTLAALLMRLADPDQGRVLVDGCNLKQATLQSVRSSLAVVLQDPFLLPVSIADNIGLGRPGASREEIYRVAKLAQADDFIRNLPQGYDTPVAEGGGGLSGGQKQRLAIARAILRDAPIVIFDEPSSALDTITEKALFDALHEWRLDRTMLLIAHRPATLRAADRVIELKNGHLSEHVDLRKAKGA